MTELWHFSEDRVASAASIPRDGKVWAIDDRHSWLYWFPRDCPRACFWAVEQTTDDDVESLARRRPRPAGGRDRDELARAPALGPAPRLPHAARAVRHRRGRAASTSRRRRSSALELVELGDLLARHAEAGNELRITPSLYPLWDKVIYTTLDFSGIRLRNAVRPMKILVAEDETIIRLDLRDLLERAGFDVCAEAKDGEEAVELARSEQPDLAVLDVKMPKLDGIEAARRILEERPIPIVMLTAYGQDELVSRAVEAGVFGYLVKPFREQDLLPAIAAARARHDELQAAARGGGVALRRARRAEGDRAGEGAADGEGAAERAGGVRAAAQGEPGVGPAAQGDRRGRRRDARRGHVSEHEHPNAALVRRVFAAFGKDAMAVSAAFARDIVWRVPGDTVMSGEYRGRRDVVEFLRRTGLETGGTYRSRLHTVLRRRRLGRRDLPRDGQPQRDRPRRRAGARDPGRGRVSGRT